MLIIYLKVPPSNLRDFQLFIWLLEFPGFKIIFFFLIISSWTLQKSLWVLIHVWLKLAHWFQWKGFYFVYAKHITSTMTAIITFTFFRKSLIEKDHLNVNTSLS